MDTQEKYITAYIVTCLTGIEGSKPERMYDVLKNSDFTIDDPFLRLIYNVARVSPESTEVKNIVAGLVQGYALAANSTLAEDVFGAVDELVKIEVDARTRNQVELVYRTEEDWMYGTIFARADGELVIEANLSIPAAYEEYTVNSFKERFPNGRVLKTK